MLTKKMAVSAGVVVVLCCVVLAFSCGDSGSKSLAGDPDVFVKTMKSEGLVVLEGFMSNVNIIEYCCDPAKLMPMCYGNNPDVPYLTAYVPEGVGQTAINSPINYYGFPPAPGSPGIGRSRSYRLGADEAIVIVGKTPPAVSLYYSYISYISLRCVTGNCFTGALPDFSSDYKRRFASTVDALNSDTIWTAGTPGGGSGDSFNKDTMIIITGDRNADRRIRDAALRSGYSHLIINTMVLPAEFVRFGIEYGNDEIGLLQRLAVWDDGYIQNPPARVFRIRSNSPVVPFPTPALTPRGGKNISERILFTNAVSELRTAILAKYAGYTSCAYPTLRADTRQTAGTPSRSTTTRTISSSFTA